MGSAGSDPGFRKGCRVRSFIVRDISIGIFHMNEAGILLEEIAPEGIAELI